MSQPTPYVRQANFTDFQASYPASPFSGVAVDAEYNAAKVTLDALLRNIALLQRDDGALKNNIVTLDSLTPDVMLALGAGVIWLPRGNWLTATVYAISDVIKSGTGSYVCAVAHTAGVFATDFAAGKWVLLFDSAGSIPADGSVTAAKMAAGAILDAAIGFTGLDLAGNIRAATGLQAGIAPLGALMHAKLAAGSPMAKVERVTDAQGAVGLQIIGPTITWTMQQAGASTDFSIFNSSLGAIVLSISPTGTLKHNGHLASIGSAAPAAGAGIAMSYGAGVGLIDAQDWATLAWKDLKVRGLTVYMTASGVDVVAVSATGMDVTGTVKRGGVELGWLDVPHNVQSGAYTLALSDRGKSIYSQNVAGQTISIPTAASVAFPSGSIVAIRNDGTNPITIDASAVTLKQSGSGATGNRTLAANGSATLHLSPVTNRWWIDGSGVS